MRFAKVVFKISTEFLNTKLKKAVNEQKKRILFSILIKNESDRLLFLFRLLI
jgi:hypothetical protein